MTLLGYQAERDELTRDIGIPRGMICMWSGSATAVPAGWALCDGTNGTPDLRDRFIVGAGSTYASGATGGAATHKHELPWYAGTTTIRWRQASNPNPWGDGTSLSMDRAVASTAENASQARALSNSASSLPSYYALCYVMKV